MSFGSSDARGGKAAVTIAPLHSLVSGVTEGTGTAELIVPAAVSPHGFNLKPSHIKKMAEAEAVIYIGDDLEHFLLKALRSLPPEVKQIPVAEKSGIALLKMRRDGGEEDEHEDEDDIDEADGHEHGAFDMHIWLSPKNAEKIVKYTAKRLSQISPRKRNAYRKNARRVIEKLKKLDAKISAELAGITEKPYFVFHDFIQYFERDYRLSRAGFITADPDTPPSAGRIKQIRAKLRKTSGACVVGEPQFGSKILQTVTEGTDAKIVLIDPLGAEFEPGPNLYFEMMEKLAAKIKQCLR